METIEHKHVQVGRLKLHVAEIGSGMLHYTVSYTLQFLFKHNMYLLLSHIGQLQVQRWCCSCMDFPRYGTHGGTK